MKVDKLFLVLVAAVVLFNFLVPIKDFPSGDDYAYFKTVENFLNGDFKLHPNLSMSFLVQGFYGAFISMVLGFSHQSLVIGTIILSSIGVFALYFLLKKFVSREWAFLGSLVLLVNPVYFYLSHTFMTDVPALALIILSVFFIYKGVQENKTKYLIVGVIFSLAAFWIRQYGITPILGLLIYYLVHKRGDLLKPKNLFLILIVPTFFVLLWFYWYYYVNGPSDCITDYYIAGPNVLRTIGKGELLAGYFFFPLALLFLLNWKSLVSAFKSLKRYSRIFVLVSVILMLGWIAFINIFQNETVFYRYFLASDLGVGTNADAIVGDKNNLFPEYFWVPITGLSIVAAASILIGVLKMKDDGKYRLLIYFMLAYGLSLLFIRGFFDRYFLLFIVLFLPFTLVFIRNLRLSKVFLIIFVLIFAFWSWYGLNDYASWNQARWDGINYLLGSGVPEEEIDGGFEYDARFFKSCIDTEGAVNFHGWAYSLSDDYVISFEKQPSYEVLKENDYSGPFGEKLGTVYVLKKV